MNDTLYESHKWYSGRAEYQIEEKFHLRRRQELPCFFQVVEHQKAVFSPLIYNFKKGWWKSKIFIPDS